jgi:hypothetical protein
MIRYYPMLLAATAQEALVSDFQNFLGRLARNLVRLARGHETLIIVILIMLLLIYLYLRKT